MIVRSNVNWHGLAKKNEEFFSWLSKQHNVTGSDVTESGCTFSCRHQQFVNLIQTLQDTAWDRDRRDTDDHWTHDTSLHAVTHRDNTTVHLPENSKLGPKSTPQVICHPPRHSPSAWRWQRSTWTLLCGQLCSFEFSLAFVRLLIRLIICSSSSNTLRLFKCSVFANSIPSAVLTLIRLETFAILINS